ncbi:MAG: hypothetical protein M0Q46_06630, partial [Endomicrobiales bacterium]|nr:hypothetical protein [Endomicrobiales bacterium]
ELLSNEVEKEEKAEEEKQEEELKVSHTPLSSDARVLSSLPAAGSQSASSKKEEKVNPNELLDESKAILERFNTQIAKEFGPNSATTRQLHTIIDDTLLRTLNRFDHLHDINAKEISISLDKILDQITGTNEMNLAGDNQPMGKFTSEILKQLSETNQRAIILYNKEAAQENLYDTLSWTQKLRHGFNPYNISDAEMQQAAATNSASEYKAS